MANRPNKYFFIIKRLIVNRSLTLFEDFQLPTLLSRNKIFIDKASLLSFYFIQQQNSRQGQQGKPDIEYQMLIPGQFRNNPSATAW
jgi:hypothetical protein